MEDKNKKGYFFVLEGTNGVGKTTQIALLIKKLHKLGHTNAIQLREPGTTEIGETVRYLLKSNPNLEPETRLFLYTAARSELVHKQILPALQDGKIIICDRYIPSSLVYQSKWFPRDYIRLINKDFPIPDLTILLDGSNLIDSRGNSTTEDIDSELINKKYLKEYDYSKLELQKWVKIDAARSIPKTHKHIL